MLETLDTGEKVPEDTMKSVLMAVNALLEDEHAMYDVLVDARVGLSPPWPLGFVLSRTC